MLLTNSLKVNDIVSIKLISGEEIIAKVVDNEGTCLVVTKPMTMSVGIDPTTNKAGIQMTPIWVLGADSNQEFPILKTNIICVLKSSTAAVSEYTRQNTGLITPKSSVNLNI